MASTRRFRRIAGASRGRLAGVAVTGLWLCGCAGFWEDVTSRDFKMKAFFSKPNPLVVLRDSTDGDQRARALLALREPRRHGGSDQEQDVVVRILTAAATTERQPLCRLAAIDALGRFQDPRAVQALKDAFYAAATFTPPKDAGAALAYGVFPSSTPPPDLVTRIQCAALTSLGQTGNPAAVELLVRALHEPQGVGDQENQQATDRRIAAARALAKFNTPDATHALVEILQKEKDVALRDRAHESLQAATGRRLPPDAKAWTEALGEPGVPHLASGPATPPAVQPAAWK